MDNDFGGLHVRLPKKNFAFGELKKIHKALFLI